MDDLRFSDFSSFLRFCQWFTGVIGPGFVETATRGQMHKGDKFIKQPPLTDGPFHLSSKMTWPDFVENVVKVAKITKENLGPTIADMKWSFQKKTGLPLMDVRLNNI